MTITSAASPKASVSAIERCSKRERTNVAWTWTAEENAKAYRILCFYLSRIEWILDVAHNHLQQIGDSHQSGDVTVLDH